MKISELKIGQTYSLSKKFTTAEVQQFSQLSMDNNPLHLDDEFASKNLFGAKIVHGYLTTSLFSAIIGTKLPGFGSIYLKQDLNFKRPIFHNELVTATVTIKNIQTEKSIVYLDTVCKKENGEIAVEGNAIVKLI